MLDRIFNLHQIEILMLVILATLTALCLAVIERIKTTDP